jgi:O-antigen/teichoic acid export membrane protein
MSNNSRGLVRSMAIIGSSQSLNIIISIIRVKALAIMLGPLGVGLLGIYSNLLDMVKTAAGLGIGKSGVRQIAVAKQDEQVLGRVRRVLLLAHIIQGSLAMGGVWIFRFQISEWLFGNNTYVTEVGLIGIAILLTLLGTAHTAILQGMRRIDDLGRVTIYSALVGSVVGLVAIWFYGVIGVVWFVIAQPLAVVIVAFQYTSRLPKLKKNILNISAFWQEWKPMAKLGTAFMLGGLATTITLLLVRRSIAQEIGLEAAGLFAAAWSISMIYVGLMLGAVSADYYPRLAEVITDRKAATKLMNDQLQLLVSIGGPILLLLIGTAPWVMTLLYSSEFRSGSELLQWMTAGNVFKLASWPLAFSIVAASRSKTFFLMELSFNVIFLILIWLLLPSLGLKSTAIALLIGYLVYFVIVVILATTLQGFRWESLSLGLVSMHIMLALILLGLTLIYPFVGAIISIFISILTGLFGLRVVLTKIGLEGQTVNYFQKFFNFIRWPI